MPHGRSSSKISGTTKAKTTKRIYIFFILMDGLHTNTNIIRYYTYILFDHAWKA